MEPEYNKYDEERSPFTTEKRSTWQKIEKTSGRKVRRGSAYSLVGVQHAQGIKEYYRKKRQEFETQHGHFSWYGS